MMRPTVIFERVHEGARLPTYATKGSAGMDVAACLGSNLSLSLAPCGGNNVIPTGLRLRYLEPGYEIQVRPRSGLAATRGITVLNAPGTIDADYRGEIKVILINHSRHRYVVRDGDRIAQLVVAPVRQAFVMDAVEAEEMLRAIDAETERGAGGFGSSGR